jgi:hypothetical protein
MTNLPSLEVREDPSKKNDYIIFRYSIKDRKNVKQTVRTGKRVFKNNISLQRKRKRKQSHRVKQRTKKKRARKSKKSFFNILL